MRRSTLIFPASKQSLQIKFRNKDISVVLNSKQDALEVINLARNEMMISKDEFIRFFDEILSTDELPWVITEKNEEKLLNYVKKFLCDKPSDLAFLFQLFEELEALSFEENENEDDVVFVPCYCGDASLPKHGTVHSPMGFSVILKNQLEANASLFELLNFGLINEIQFENTQKQAEDYFVNN